MSSFRALVHQLRENALAAPTRYFEKARSRHSALAAFESIAAVFKAFADDRAESYPERETLTRALLLESRASDDTIWVSILLVAYYPMLSRLRYRLVSNHLARDELDQLVLAAFVEVLRNVPLDEGTDRLAMRLRQGTQRLVFAALRKEHEEQHFPLMPDEVVSLRAEDPFSTAHEQGHSRLDLAMLLKLAVEAGIPKSTLEVISATMLRRELLRNYVERIGPADDRERERLYQRLKRQRTRTLVRLRSLLADSPLLSVSF